MWLSLLSKPQLHWCGRNRSKMILNCFINLTVWILLCSLQSRAAEITCKNNFINNITVTTELQSDVLLPCYFEPNLLGSNKTADISAVWTYRNIPVEYLVEIKLQGNPRLLNIRGGRIETFPKFSESGNFSILLHKVQQSDLGLYYCHLYKGINCSIAFQKLHLSKRFKEPVAERFPPWLITVGTLGGGIVLLGLFIFCCLCVKRRKNISHETVCENNESVDAVRQPDRGSKNTHDGPIYTTIIHPKVNTSTREKEENNESINAVRQTDRGSEDIPDGPIYTTIIHPKVNTCTRENEGAASDSPVYAAVKTKTGKRAQKKNNHMEQVV